MFTSFLELRKKLFACTKKNACGIPKRATAYMCDGQVIRTNATANYVVTGYVWTNRLRKNTDINTQVLDGIISGQFTSSAIVTITVLWVWSVWWMVGGYYKILPTRIRSFHLFLLPSSSSSLSSYPPCRFDFSLIFLKSNLLSYQSISLYFTP